MIPVEGHKNLYRDEDSGAIVNTDSSGYNQYMQMKSARLTQREELDKMREDITRRMGIPVTLSIQEIRKPDLDAKLLAESVAQQLERRVMFRRAMKRAVQNAMRQGAEGVKIRVAGRLGGAEIARAEIQKEGRVPLHTLRADVDYGLAEANTTYGVIGVKAWVFRGEVLDKPNKDSE